LSWSTAGGWSSVLCSSNIAVMFECDAMLCSFVYDIQTRDEDAIYGTSDYTTPNEFTGQVKVSVLLMTTR